MDSRAFQIRIFATILIFFALYTIPAWVLYYYGYIPTSYLIGFHGIVLGFLSLQYYSGTRFALRAVNAEDFNNPYYKRVTAELADEMNVPTPQLKIGQFGMLNAFAVGRKGNGYVVLSESLFHYLDEDEIEAIIAHEISHLKSRDTTVMLIGESLDYVVYEAKWRATNSVEGVIGGILATIVVIVGVILRGIILIPLRLISRYREYIADRDAAYYTGKPLKLVSALDKIGHYNSQIDEYPLQAKEVHELCIFNDGFSITERVLGTHPPTEKRIERLEYYYEDMVRSDYEE